MFTDNWNGYLSCCFQILLFTSSQPPPFAVQCFLCGMNLNALCAIFRQDDYILRQKCILKNSMCIVFSVR